MDKQHIADSDWATFHELARQCGGRFRLCTLMQKRLQQLYRAAVPGTDKSKERVLREIENDVIGLRQVETGSAGELPPAPELGNAEEEE